MSEGSGINVTTGQLNLIARRYGVFTGSSLLDVGCGDGAWVSQLRKRSLAVQGLEERQQASAAPVDGIAVGSPAATVPGAAQSFDRVLFRGTSVRQATAFQPELMIALANLGSVLKPHGRLLIPVAADNQTEIEKWQSMLSIFPGSIRVRQLSSGIAAYLTLAFLFGGNHRVTVVDLNVQDKQVSRLEWHRLAREAVMQRMRKNEAA
ncbi:class I SAM-dependent methyltransferase [Planctomicrobium piriforme]|uniref:Methyltransferase domain-containing protein n=1 Tax=Planctomicrobium piriforme TaxID=1576369 RepID=A0A1I3GYM8_9PLAN|nr:methyltransferase domain-containing protein [Planctomicrobium piriforme]SFI28417.1 Methyltransferase domain-containing protein [Planctomicrobium piriforme]